MELQTHSSAGGAETDLGSSEQQWVESDQGSSMQQWVESDQGSSMQQGAESDLEDCVQQGAESDLGGRVQQGVGLSDSSPSTRIEQGDMRDHKPESSQTPRRLWCDLHHRSHVHTPMRCLFFTDHF